MHCCDGDSGFLGGGAIPSSTPSGDPSFERSIIWVDDRVGPGGVGTEASPFNTVGAGLPACPDGGTLNFIGGDASADPGLTLDTRSLNVFGLSGQVAASGQTPALPTLTYSITSGLQYLAFRNVTVTLVHAGTATGLTRFSFELCPTITLTGGSDTAPVTWVGDSGCTFSGAGGPGTFNGGTIAGYVANSGAISVSSCRITGDLTSSSSVTLANACTFGAGVSVNAPVISIDASSYANALTAGVTFSITPTLLSPTAVESDVGTANAAGTTNKNSRVGHVHALPIAVWLAVAATANAPIAINNQRITNLAAPVSGGDAVNKTYADALASGLKVKTPAVVVATANQGTMSGTAQTIDGVALNTIGQRVLLTAQSTATQNGLWTVQSGAWTRPADFATGSGAAQSYVLITGGTAGAGSSYYCTSTAGSDVVDTNNLTWTLFSQAAVITAGAGLTKTGNTLDVVANADGTIVVAADDVKVGTLISANFANNTITPARLTNAGAQGDFLMRVSSGSGAWEDGTAAQARSALGLFQVASWQPVRAATTGNITLSGTQTIDGVACIAGDRVLVWQQSTGSQNGLYSVASGAWSRCLDAASSSQFFGGMTVAISEGGQGNRVAFLDTNDPITIGSTSLTFSLSRVAAIGAVAPQDVTTGAASSGSSTLAAPIDHVHHIDAATITAAITAGTGCSFTSTTLNVNANADGTIVANANDIQVGTLIAANYAVNTIALTKLSNAAAQFDLVGRKTASGGSWEDCTPAQLQLVTYGRFVNTGAGLTGGGDLSVDRTISLGTVANSNLADNTIALSRLVNAGAQNHFIMRKSASAGAWEDGSQSEALTGLGITIGTSGKFSYSNGTSLGNTTTFTTDGAAIKGASYYSSAGTNVASIATGVLRAGHGETLVAVRNNANDGDYVVARFGQGTTDLLYWGAFSTDTKQVSLQRWGVKTGGSYQWEINGGAILDFDGTTVNAHSQAFTAVASMAQSGGTAASSGWLRGRANQNLVTANIANISGFIPLVGTDSNDNATFGSTQDLGTGGASILQGFDDALNGRGVIVRVGATGTGSTEDAIVVGRDAHGFCFNTGANTNVAFYGGTPVSRPVIAGTSTTSVITSIINAFLGVNLASSTVSLNRPGGGVFFFGASTTANNQFLNPGGATANGASSASVTGSDIVIPVAGTLSNLAGGSSGANTLTVTVNGSTTALTISPNSNIVDDTTHTVTVAAKDTVSIKITSSGGGLASASFLFTPS